MSETSNESPAHGELADDDDQLSWDRARDGRMAEHAAADDAVDVERVPREREQGYGGADEDAPSAPDGEAT